MQKKYKLLLLISGMLLVGLGIHSFFPRGQLVGGTICQIYQGCTSTATAPTNGQLLIGNASGTYTVAALTAGSNITLTPGSGTLQISSTGGASSTPFSGIGVFNGSTFTHITSLSFDSNMFDLANTASLSTIRLDWTNGPASRSSNETITGQWNFTAVGSSQFSGSLGVSKGLTANTYNGASLQTCDPTTGKLMWTAGVFGCGTDQGANVTNHSDLGNLAWTSSGHTGTASTLASFNASGVASASTESKYFYLDGSRALTGRFLIGSGDTPAMYVTGATGNVGMGTSTAEAKLDVVGSILASTSGNVDLTLRSTTSDDTKFTFRSVGASDRLDILGSASQQYLSISKGGQVQFRDGTVSIPAISFINDTNTGIFREGADSMSLTAGGVKQLNITGTTASISNAIFVSSTDKIGIATASPYAALSVGISAGSNVTDGTHNMSTEGLLVHTNNNNATFTAAFVNRGQVNNEGVFIKSVSKQLIIQDSDGTPLFTINDIPVGIGTTAPISRLSVGVNTDDVASDSAYTMGTVGINVRGEDSGRYIAAFENLSPTSGGVLIKAASLNQRLLSVVNRANSQTLLVRDQSVAIGSDSSPDAWLEVVGDGTKDVFLVSSAEDPSPDGDYFSIKNGGNVGIGTANVNASFELKAGASTTNAASISAMSLTSGHLLQLRGSVTTGSIASISALSLNGGAGALDGGGVFHITVPASSSTNNAHGLLLVRDTNSRIIASWSMGGKLALTSAIRSRGATSTCTGLNVPAGAQCVDYAESYPSDGSLRAGDVAQLNLETGNAEKATNDTLILGVVSTHPAALIDGNALKTGEDAKVSEGHVPIALAGRVPVKVSGSVKAGQRLGVKDGKAVPSNGGFTIGFALEDSHDGEVLMFVQNIWWGGTTESNGLWKTLKRLLRQILL